MKHFNYRVQDIEVRSCDRYLLTNNKPHDRAEIIKWEKDKDNIDYCYTLAYFVPDKHEEDYDLQFVGGRPFNVDWYEFMVIADQGYKMLKAALEEIN